MLNPFVILTNFIDASDNIDPICGGGDGCGLFPPSIPPFYLTVLALLKVFALLWIVWICIQFLRKKYSGQEKKLQIGMIAGLFISIFSSVVWFTWDFAFDLLVFIVLVGIYAWKTGHKILGSAAVLILTPVFLFTLLPLWYQNRLDAHLEAFKAKMDESFLSQLDETLEAREETLPISIYDEDFLSLLNVEVGTDIYWWTFDSEKDGTVEELKSELDENIFNKEDSPWKFMMEDTVEVNINESNARILYKWFYTHKEMNVVLEVLFAPTDDGAVGLYEGNYYFLDPIGENKWHQYLHTKLDLTLDGECIKLFSVTQESENFPECIYTVL